MSKKPLYDPVAELQLLPQFPKINPKHIQPWIDQVETIDPDRLPWHVRRLSGIGGSEIGILVGQLRGLFHPHVSAYQLVRAKLLMDLPVEPDGPLIRGQVMEEPSRALYRDQIKKRFPNAKGRDDIIQHLGSFRDPKYPWVIGTPDEVMEMEPGKIWIVDYKCPSQDVVDSYHISGVPFYYSAQLHHYRYIASQMGYEIAGLQLAALNWKHFRIDTWDVPYDPLLEKDCLFAGTHYWNNFVLTGELPHAGTAKKFGNATDLPENVVESAVAYATFRHIGNHFTRQADTIGDNIKNTAAKLDPNIDSVTVGIVDLKAKRELDIEGMAKTLQAHNIPLSDLQAPPAFDHQKVLEALLLIRGVTPEQAPTDPFFQQLMQPNALDPDKVFEQFRKANLDLAPFIQEEHISFALSRGKSNYAETLINGIKEEISKQGPQFAQQIQEHMIDVEEQFHLEAPTKKSGPKV